MAMQACRSSQLHIQEMSLKMHRRELFFGDALERDVDALEKGGDAEGREMGIWSFPLYDFGSRSDSETH